MTKISFHADWHGGLNRKSALADYLELLAVHGVRMTHANLADFIQDAGLERLLGERIQPSRQEPQLSIEIGTDDSSDEYSSSLAIAQSEAYDLATSVQDLIQQREDTLGVSYPFRIHPRGNGISRRHHASGANVYLAHLAITICHCEGILIGQRRACDVFEDSVESSFAARGLNTACLKGASTDYATALTSACKRVSLSADPSAASYRHYAVDEGTDTVSNMWPTDNRQGGWQFIGQATCARSDKWRSKLLEPSISKWRKWLGRTINPIAFLAVPHHVENATLTYLLEVDESRDVVDRLRLASTPRTLTQDEALAVLTITGSTVEAPL